MRATNSRNVDLIVKGLRTRVEPTVDDETLTALVEADFTRYERARIRDFVPALVERDVRERLLRR
jgi:hypothetical protein